MIIDASVAFKLVVEEEGSAAAASWVGGTTLHAPYLLLSEVANAVWKAITRGQLSSGGAAERVETLAELIMLRDETELMPRALEMAVTLRHPVYDCVYLAMAEAAGSKMLTADRKLIRAVEGSAFHDLLEELAI